MTDTSNIRALQEAMERKKPYYPEWIDARYTLSEALVTASPDLLNELDRLRKFKARIESATSNYPYPCNSYNGKGLGACGWKRAYADVVQALATPVEGGEYSSRNPNTSKRNRAVVPNVDDLRLAYQFETQEVDDDGNVIIGFDQAGEMFDRAIAAHGTDGGGHVHLFRSDGCITFGCPTQVCASCGHVENPHVEGCKAAGT